jgi:exonuclease SbcD
MSAYFAGIKGEKRMRILHTGDWHLGRTLEGRSRLIEQEAFLDELVQIVKDQQVDLVLMAGDVYDSVNPPAAAEAMFYDAAARLTETGCHLAVIAGNHDQPERVAAVSPLVARRGISLVGLPVSEAITVPVPRTGETAVIAALPYPSEARLSELLAGDADESELRLAYSAKVGILMRQLAGAFRPDTVNLAMSHIYVLGGVESDSERPIQVGGAYTVDPSALDIGAQYTALGHLHRPQAVKGAGLTRYSGSPLAYSFSEAGQAKSVMLLDVVPGKEPILEELYLSSGRPLVRWSCRGGLAEAYRWLEEGRDANAFIDLEISLTEAMALSDIQALRKAHDGIVHIRPVYPGRELQEELVSRESVPVHELFRKFYQRQTGGAEPEEELVELFMSLVSEEEDESAAADGAVEGGSR